MLSIIYILVKKGILHARNMQYFIAPYYFYFFIKDRNLHVKAS